MMKTFLLSLLSSSWVISSLFSQTTVNFSYTGSSQTWTVPPCVTSITVTCAGADGGGPLGGNGAVVTGTLTVTPGQTLTINVGGSGGSPSGGWNGGGNGQAASPSTYNSYGGGGATDIRISPNGLANRLIVAAGGGGENGGSSSYLVSGGAGGCGSGANGLGSVFTGTGGVGASQTAGGPGGPPWGGGQYGQGGTLGQGGNGGYYSTASGGGGGGGYYGGGGGGSDNCCTGANGGGAGGGGSSLVPAGGGCTQGSNNGPGYVVITYTGGTATATPTNTGPYCAGSTIQLNTSAGTSYSWTGPNGFTSTLQNPTIPAATAANAGVYTVTVTNTGCTATGSTTVVVNPLPVVNGGVDQTVCQGTNVTLTASGATTYSWSGGISQGVAFTPSAGTTTYTVTGTTSGCTATDQVNVTMNPTPTVNAGPDQAVCAGTSVILTASGTATTYSWNNSVSDGVAFVPASTMTYTLTGTGTGGCQATDQAIVTVNPIPVVNAGTDQTVCDGTSVTLTATGANTYTWDNGVTQAVSFTPTVGTLTYSVTGTTTAGCTSSDQVQVTVNSNPTPTIQGVLIYCTPNPPTLTADQTYAGYNWSSGESSSSITGNAANNPLTVTVTDANGCQGTSPSVNLTENSVINTAGLITICQGQTALIHGNNESVAGAYSQTFTSVDGCDSVSVITLNVNPLPNVNAGTDNALCAGTSVTLSASGAVTYTWDNSVNQGVAFIPLTTATYTVSGTDVNGCVNTDQVTITVNPIPVVDAGPDQIECAGTSVTLTGNGAATYTWSNNVTDGVAFVPLATANYTVTGTSAAGCVDQDQVTVTINPMPNVNAGSDQTICEGETVTLNGSGANTYTWDNGVTNGVPFSPTVGTVVYTVVGATNAGCYDTDQVSVTVESTPVVTFVADDLAGCTPLTVNLTNTTSNVNDCQWTITNGTSISGCGTVQVLFEQGGCFNVTLNTTSSNGCTGTFTAQQYICAEEPPVASFAPLPQSVSALDPSVIFNNTTTGAVSYTWDLGDGTVSTEESPEHNYPIYVAGNYDVMLIAVSPMGCLDTAYSYVEVQEELIYYIPNTFTPDDDIFNQTFTPIFTSGFDPYNFHMAIYDRWGEVIFETYNAEVGWDGTLGAGDTVKKCQDGIYTWKIKFKIRNNDEWKEAVGHVNLIR